MTRCKLLHSKAIWNRAVQRNKPESWFFITGVHGSADPASLQASSAAENEELTKTQRQESLIL